MNLLSTGNTFTEIDIDTHPMTLIVGHNGSGKSTFIDAISFALYGKPFRKINKPQLINSINAKNLLCEIEFSINSNEYLVRRGMRPNIFEIIQNGTLVNQDAATRDYQEYLEKHILRMNHKSFTQIVTLGSSTYVPFMQMPAHARREFNENLLDIQIFSTMYSLLKDKLSENKGNIIDVKYKATLAQEKIDMQNKHILSLKQSSDKIIEGKKTLIQNMRDSISDLVEQNRLLNTQVEELELSVNDEAALSKKQTSLLQLEKQMETRQSKLQKEIAFFRENDSCPTCKQSIDDTFKADSVSDRERKEHELCDALTKLEEEYNAVSLRLADIKEVRDKIIDLWSTINTNNNQVDFIQKQIQLEESEVTKVQGDDDTIKEETAKLVELQNQLVEYTAETETLIKQKSTLDLASVLLKDSGIKAKIIKQYVPIMNKLINKYLTAMDFFVQFELDENFNEKIRSRHRDDFSYESFSEGEKCRIDLALMLCWRTISKLRNSNSTNLLVMDEIFDGALDATGSEEFMKILKTLLGDSNIFIISHKTENISDKFGRILKFDKVKNFSRMSV